VATPKAKSRCLVYPDFNPTLPDTFWSGQHHCLCMHAQAQCSHDSCTCRRRLIGLLWGVLPEPQVWSHVVRLSECTCSTKSSVLHSGAWAMDACPMHPPESCLPPINMAEAEHGCACMCVGWVPCHSFSADTVSCHRVCEHHGVHVPCCRHSQHEVLCGHALHCW
jgi:hypothetical protein